MVYLHINVTAGCWGEEVAFNGAAATGGDQPPYILCINVPNVSSSKKKPMLRKGCPLGGERNATSPAGSPDAPAHCTHRSACFDMVSICKDAAYASATADETEENVQQLQM